MADALVSAALEQLVTITSREAEQEVRLVVGVKDEVRKLTRTFKIVQRVLADAETRQLKEEDVKLWLDDLRDICYEMDDVLDEWSTEINKWNLVQKLGEDEEHVLPKHKSKMHSLIAYCSCFRLGKKIGLRYDIAHRIKDLYERLEGVANENERRLKFAISDERSKEHVIERSVTSSFVDKAEVKGREQDKKKIVDMLLNLSGSSLPPNLRVISIVGMGGLGKTTLAQLVYDDEKIKDHFGERIWVCVSDPFDVIKIANSILQSLMRQASTFGTLQPIMEKVQYHLRGKRFLLILDDVWNESHQKWKQLKDGVVNWGSRGSRILVTTRKENVAVIMGCTKSDIFQPGLLPPEECWSVFSEIALFDRTPEECQQLEGIGRKIAHKCNGLPLAAKTLGGLLRFKKSKAQWENVLKSEVWQLDQDEITTNLFAPLWLSYYDLRPQLKQCFSFCAFFPKDYRMDKNFLIKIWMSQGYLKGTENEDMEMIGEDYFNNLSHRSFFQDFRKNKNGLIMDCKMHDIVHDFSQFITKNEYVSMEVKDDIPTNEPFVSKNDHIRHLFVELKCNSLPQDYFHSFKQLRTLFVDVVFDRMYEDCEVGVATFLSIFKELTCLRCLSLNKCKIREIPSTIGSLKHLRYLSLSSNLFKELPKSICELHNLQTLILLGCRELVELPTEIGKLINLRHLYMLNGGVRFLPKGIGRLTSLRTLDIFNVGHGPDECCLPGLKRINHLSGYIYIKNLGEVATDAVEVKEALFKEKKNISQLILEFCKEKKAEREPADQKLIEVLEPPPNLEKLEIRNYQGSKIFQEGCTHWMPILEKLKVITLRDLINLEILPPLGKLPFLENLVLLGTRRVKKVGIEFLGLHHNSDKGVSSSSTDIVAFPNLKLLTFWQMDNLEEWDFELNKTNTHTDPNDGAKNIIEIMPRITYFSISYCPILKALPDQLIQRTTLKHVNIVGCNLLKKRYNKETGDDWPKISHVPKLRIS